MKKIKINCHLKCVINFLGNNFLNELNEFTNECLMMYEFIELNLEKLGKFKFEII